MLVLLWLSGTVFVSAQTTARKVTEQELDTSLELARRPGNAGDVATYS